MNKNVAIIIERADIMLGGAQRSVFELAAALSALGLQVHTLAAKGQANSANITLLCQDSPGKRTNYFTFAKALKQHLAENHYDIIHSVVPFDFADVYQPRGGSFAESILRNAASYRNAFISHYKKLTSFANFRRTTLLLAEKTLCRTPNGPIVAALSDYVACQFKQHYGLSDDRVVVVPNAIKTNQAVDSDKTEKLRLQILAQLNLKAEVQPILFLFVANNFRLKGLAVLIKALQLATANQQGRQACLIVAGRGKSSKYRTLAKRLDVQSKIVFLGQIRHIQNALSIADVAVLPTFYDPSSRFTLEAIAAGKPVITTKFNGVADLFVNDRHGKVIDMSEDAGALAEAVRHFTNPDNIQEASRAIVEDNLKEKVSIDRHAKQLVSLYESILQRKG